MPRTPVTPHESENPMTHLLLSGPHHSVATLDVLALALTPVCLYGIWYIVRQFRRLFALARVPVTAAPAALPLEDIPEARLVRTPITADRKAIGR